jgi:Kdo2-lipid IVA lauroyltransferase/acyltransferase
MEKTGYFLLKTTTWIFRLFPLRFHYHIATISYFLFYHIFRYRRGVVESNLANSFPEKSVRERTRIAKHFYRHFCDVFVETLYFDRISVHEGKSVVNYTNADLPNSYLNQGRQVVIILGHYNNWEWFCNWPLYSKYQFYPIYKKLKSKAFERFYIKLRGRFGAIPLERSDTFRQLIHNYQNGIPSVSAFLFDQTPRIYEIQHWVKFLNQETPVILGAEKIARKTNAVVLFAKSRKLKRGKYEVEYQLVTDHPADCAKFEITDKCIKLLEKQINEHPEFWLWSHKRWKHKRAKVA